MEPPGLKSGVLKRRILKRSLSILALRAKVFGRESINLAFLILLLLGWSICASCEISERQPEHATVSANQVNIRAGGGLNFEVLGQLNASEQVVVTSEESGWYRIRLPDQARCFIRSDFVIQNTVSARRLRVRAGPGEGFNVLGVLTKGQEVKVIRKDGDWLQIAPPDNCQGWIKKGLLKLSGNEATFSAQPEIRKQPEPESKIEISGIVDDVGKVFNRPGAHKLQIDKNNFYYLTSKTIDFNQYLYQQVEVTGTAVDLKNHSHPVLAVEQIKVKQ